MRTEFVVDLSPLVDHLTCVIEREEDVLIQALLSKFPVEGFDKCVLLRLAWLNEVDLESLVCPGLKRSRPELGSVVTANSEWRLIQAIEKFCETLSCDRIVDDLSDTDSREVINDVEHLHFATIFESIMNEVHRPNLVRRGWLCDCGPHNGNLLSSRAMTYLKSLFTINTKRAFTIDDKPLAPAHTVDRNQSPALVTIGKLLHSSDQGVVLLGLWLVSERRTVQTQDTTRA